MPIYEYRCEKGHTFEVMQRMTDDPIANCTTCSRPVARVFHPIAVHFKGKGFYNTDYGTRKRNRETSAAAESGADSTAEKSKDKAKEKGSDTGGSSDAGGSSDGGATKPDKKTESPKSGASTSKKAPSAD